MKNLYKIENELYIVSSSEKIKENTQTHIQGFNGDWFYNTIYNFIARIGDITSYDFKIILTTNKLLIKDGVQQIDDEFLEWFVKNSSCESVEIRYTVDFNSKAVIIIPKEEPKQTVQEYEQQGLEKYSHELKSKQDYKKMSKKFTETLTSIPDDVLIKYTQQETLEEAAKDYIENTMRFSFNSMETKTQANRMLKCVEFGAKWQKERSYSEKEVFELLNAFNKHTLKLQELKLGNSFSVTDWFEQFKKK